MACDPYIMVDARHAFVLIMFVHYTNVRKRVLYSQNCGADLGLWIDCVTGISSVWQFPCSREMVAINSRQV